MLKKIKIRLSILIICTCIIQTTFIPYISIYNVQPDLFYGLFILLILQFSNIQAIFLAFIIGAIKDLYSSHLFGLEIISLLIPALSLPFVVKKADMNNYFVRFFVIFLFSITSFFVLLISIAVIEKSCEVIKIFSTRAIGAALYTAVIAFLLSYLIKKLIPRKTEQYELF